MNRLLAAGCVFALSTLPSLSQETAAVDPAASVDLAGVIGQCEVAATVEGTAAPTGLCTSTTQSYLASLSGSDPAIKDQAVTDLVVALVPLATADEACTVVDTEIANAIRLAATYASTPEQVARVVEIGDTIAECDPAATADVTPLEDEEVSPG